MRGAERGQAPSIAVKKSREANQRRNLSKYIEIVESFGYTVTKKKKERELPPNATEAETVETPTPEPPVVEEPARETETADLPEVEAPVVVKAPTKKTVKKN